MVRRLRRHRRRIGCPDAAQRLLGPVLPPTDSREQKRPVNVIVLSIDAGDSTRQRGMGNFQIAAAGTLRRAPGRWSPRPPRCSSAVLVVAPPAHHHHLRQRRSPTGTRVGTRRVQRYVRLGGLGAPAHDSHEVCRSLGYARPLDRYMHSKRATGSRSLFTATRDASGGSHRPTANPCRGRDESTVRRLRGTSCAARPRHRTHRRPRQQPTYTRRARRRSQQQTAGGPGGDSARTLGCEARASPLRRASRRPRAVPPRRRRALQQLRAPRPHPPTDAARRACPPTLLSSVRHHPIRRPRRRAPELAGSPPSQPGALAPGRAESAPAAWRSIGRVCATPMREGVARDKHADNHRGFAISGDRRYAGNSVDSSRCRPVPQRASGDAQRQAAAAAPHA